MTIDEAYARRSVQNALLGAVSPKLRVVVVRLEEKSVFVSFFYDGEISESDRDAASCALAEIISDFPPDFELNDQIERVDFPKEVPILGSLVFKRKE